jgi:hypothetical protein
MLATQVNYWANQEIKRHNLVNEEQNLTDLNRRAAELELSVKSLDETIRHNMASETIDKNKAKAAILQAQAARKQAQAALRKVKADIQVAKANVEVARSNTKLNRSRTALTNVQVAGTRASTAATRAGTKKTKAETKLTNTRQKYYKLTDIVNPMMSNVVKGVSVFTHGK